MTNHSGRTSWPDHEAKTCQVLTIIPMKPYRNLYPSICAWENLEYAYRRARKGKRGRAPAGAA